MDQHTATIHSVGSKEGVGETALHLSTYPYVSMGWRRKRSGVGVIVVSSGEGGKGGGESRPEG